MSADAELLRSLCRAPGPTGFEAPAQEVLRRRLAPLGEVRADPPGNIWLDVGPAGGPQVVVTAHADKIGLTVIYVDDRASVYWVVRALELYAAAPGAAESFVPRI